MFLEVLKKAKGQNERFICTACEEIHLSVASRSEMSKTGSMTTDGGGGGERLRQRISTFRADRAQRGGETERLDGDARGRRVRLT